jgi:Radical SAM superfamily
MTLLSHLDHVEGLRNGRFLPPVMVDVNPVVGVCNLDCVWCCQTHHRERNEARFMSLETIRALGPFTREWGVKAWRVSGDSDPTLHPKIAEVLETGIAAGMDVGLISNGILLDRVESVTGLAWVGISLDAGTEKSWRRYKGGRDGEFERILDNVAKLRRRHPGLDIALKFLLVDDASLSAAAFGDLPATPRATEPALPSNRAELSIVEVLAAKLGVRVIVREAYTSASRPAFARCVATPLSGVFDAQHTFHLCCDARGRYVLTDDYTRDDWRELLRLWGSDAHKALVESIVPRDCAGCAKKSMNEEITKYVSNNQLNFI